LYEQIRYEERGPVRLITIDRPERMNAIGPVTSREMIDAWGRFREDDEALVAVITGAGSSAFCAGADLKAAAAGFSEENDEEPLVRWTPEEVEAHNRGERDGIIGPSRWTDIYKPIIAAVNGVAYAGGLEWACFADIRIADEHASFGVTCRRWNIGLGDGGTQRLPRIVGMGRAMELIITGRVIGAAEAERIGLVNEVTPSGECVGRALALAEAIAELPQPAIHTDKEAAVRGYGRPLPEGLRIEAQCFNKLLTSPEMVEGVRRFVERDHPDRDPAGGTVTPGLARSSPDG
jgi:enoyl-CoA hydratase